MAAWRRQKSTIRELRLSTGARQRETVLFYRRLILRAHASEAARQVTNYLGLNESYDLPGSAQEPGAIFFLMTDIHIQIFIKCPQWNNSCFKRVLLVLVLSSYRHTK